MRLTPSTAIPATMYTAVRPLSVLWKFSANGAIEQQRGSEVVARRVHRERQHLGHAERVLGEHADDEHGRSDNNAGRHGLAAPADGEGDDDESGADCIVGDGVQPRRE